MICNVLESLGFLYQYPSMKRLKGLTREVYKEIEEDLRPFATFLNGDVTFDVSKMIEVADKFNLSVTEVNALAYGPIPNIAPSFVTPLCRKFKALKAPEPAPIVTRADISSWKDEMSCQLVGMTHTLGHVQPIFKKILSRLEQQIDSSDATILELVTAMEKVSLVYLKTMQTAKAIMDNGTKGNVLIQNNFNSLEEIQKQLAMDQEMALLTSSDSKKVDDDDF